MPPRDAFDPEILVEHLLFSAVLGLGLGMAVAGAWLAKREQSYGGAALVVAGLLAGVVSGASAFNRLPVHPLDFQLKVYLTEAVESASIALAGLAGAALAFAAVFAFRRRVPRAAWAPAIGLSALSLAGLAVVHQFSSTERLFHPAGTDTGDKVGATIVIDGVESASGLALAPNGDLAAVEVFATRFRLFVPTERGFEPKAEARLPIADGNLAFHVVFHPEYPRQPFVFVSARDVRAGTAELRVFLGRIDGSSVEFEAAIDGLPIGQAGNHYGSALAFCGNTLYVSTGDTEFGETIFAPVKDGVTVRQRAQRLDDGAGKILRYRLNGAALEVDPAVDTPLPVYAMGFRNPFGITCLDAEVGTLAVAENGAIGHDQVRIVEAGTNHGWPISNRRDEIEPPLIDTGTAIITPTGVAVRETGRGRELLVSAFFTESLYALPLDAATPKLRLLADAPGGGFAVVADARGCAYFSSANAIWRLDDGRCTP